MIVESARSNGTAYSSKNVPTTILGIACEVVWISATEISSYGVDLVGDAVQVGNSAKIATVSCLIAEFASSIAEFSIVISCVLALVSILRVLAIIVSYL